MECKTDCDSLYVLFDNDEKQCVTDCAPYQRIVDSTDTHKCVYQSCDGGFVALDGTCADSCNTSYFTKTQNRDLCVKKCPKYYR